MRWFYVNYGWRFARRLRRLVFRAGWPDYGNQRIGRWWVWVGPYVIGWGWE